MFSNCSGSMDFFEQPVQCKEKITKGLELQGKYLAKSRDEKSKFKKTCNKIDLQTGKKNIFHVKALKYLLFVSN